MAPPCALVRARGDPQAPQDWAREQVWLLCKLAGVPPVTPQGLRGTLATMGRELGNTSQQVADLLGHASPAITDRAYIDGQWPPMSPETFSDLRVSGPIWRHDGRGYPSGFPLLFLSSMRGANGRTRTGTVLPTGT